MNKKELARQIVNQFAEDPTIENEGELAQKITDHIAEKYPEDITDLFKEVFEYQLDLAEKQWDRELDDEIEKFPDYTLIIAYYSVPERDSVRLTAALLRMSDNELIYFDEKWLKPEADIDTEFEEFATNAIKEADKYENCLVCPLDEPIEQEYCPCCEIDDGILPYASLTSQAVLEIMREDYLKKHEKLKRNQPCYCKSGKKYKKCHLAHDQKVRSQEYLEHSQHLDLDGLDLDRATKRKIREAFIKLPEEDDDLDMVVASWIPGKTVDQMVAINDDILENDGLRFISKREAKAIATEMVDFNYEDIGGVDINGENVL